MYKDEYIQALFDYYHEKRPDEGPDCIETPLVPVWKPEDDSPEHATFEDDEHAAATGVSNPSPTQSCTAESPALLASADAKTGGLIMAADAAMLMRYMVQTWAGK
jgi:hypothetical protein